MPSTEKSGTTRLALGVITRERTEKSGTTRLKVMMSGSSEPARQVGVMLSVTGRGRVGVRVGVGVG